MLHHIWAIATDNSSQSVRNERKNSSNEVSRIYNLDYGLNEWQLLHTFFTYACCNCVRTISTCNAFTISSLFYFILFWFAYERYHLLEQIDSSAVTIRKMMLISPVSLIKFLCARKTIISFMIFPHNLLLCLFILFSVSQSIVIYPRVWLRSVAMCSNILNQSLYLINTLVSV